MSAHDPLCPFSVIQQSGCKCYWIDRARADERERAIERAERAATHHEFQLTDGTVFDTLVSLNEVCDLISEKAQP